MTSNAASERKSIGIVGAHLARIADEGSATHTYAITLASASSPGTTRDLADAVHLLCAVHGKFPGLADIACTIPSAAPREWLRSAADALERERLFLVRLTSAIGPIPSTPRTTRPSPPAVP